MDTNVCRVERVASPEVTCRLVAADIAWRIGYPDYAARLRDIARRFADLEQLEVSTS